ncbi:MAG: hypothetical protein ABJQ71_22700 [Roseibium sp.]
MSISGAQIGVYYETLRSAYPDIDDLGTLLFLKLMKEIDDLSSPGKVHKKRIMDVIRKSVAEGWVDDLILIVVKDPDQGANTTLQQALAPMLVMLEPEPGVSVCEHLTTDGVAFVNRSTLRGIIGDMTMPDGPRALGSRRSAQRHQLCLEAA